MDIARAEHGVVAAWLVKIVLLVAVGGILVYEAGALFVNHVTLASTADDIVHELSADAAASGQQATASALMPAATLLARDAEARLVALEVDPHGVLRIRLRRPAQTIVVRNVDALRKWGRAAATAEASTR